MVRYHRINFMGIIHIVLQDYLVAEPHPVSTRLRQQDPVLSEEGVSAEQPVVQQEEVHSAQELAVMSAVQALEGLVKQGLLNQV